jgi:glycosyltransferase involved in cell wall biosynthesis
MAIEAVTRNAGELHRVLYAIALDPSRKFGSLEEQILMLAIAFRERGSLLVPLFITGPGSGLPIGFAEAGVEAHCLDLSRFDFRTLRRLLDLISRHRLQVAHWGMVSPLFTSYIWALSVLRPRMRHCFSDHSSRTFPLAEPRPFFVRWFKRLLLRRFSRVLCISEFVRLSQEQQGVWSNHSTCRYFINTDRFRPDPEAGLRLREGRGDGGRFVALVVGQLIPEKGIDVLLRALPLTPPSVVLWVGGEGAYGPALEELAVELGVADRVRFLGSLVDTSPFMKAADCFVCPSVWAEAVGLVNMEAQACGLPVIASRVGGIPEYVEDGRTGLLFPPGDHEQLAAHLRRLYEDPSLLRDMGLAARDHAVRDFSPDARLEDYLAPYRVGESPVHASTHPPPEGSPGEGSPPTLLPRFKS